MKYARSLILLVAMPALALLVSCGSTDQEELQQWMKEQRDAARPKIEPVQEPTKFAPQTYTQAGEVEPFSNLKLTQALKRDSTQTSSNAALMAPELARRKEPLEAQPLDAISMVGSLLKSGRPVALVKVDSLIYQVGVGNYLGQNYGLVTQVTDVSISLREIVQDASGEWVERTAALQLLEGSK